MRATASWPSTTFTLAPGGAVRQDLQNIGPVDGAIMGTLFLGGGLAILGVAIGWIHVDPESVHVPRWVLGVCGVMFALPGVGALYYGLVNGIRGGPRPERETSGAGFEILPWLIGLAIAGGMATVSSWIAFGPGEREFSGGIGFGWISVGGSSSETSGRVVFGIVAVMAGIFTLWGLIYGIRRLAGGDGRPRSSSTSWSRTGVPTSSCSRRTPSARRSSWSTRTSRSSGSRWASARATTWTIRLPA